MLMFWSAWSATQSSAAPVSHAPYSGARNAVDRGPSRTAPDSAHPPTYSNHPSTARIAITSGTTRGYVGSSGHGRQGERVRRRRETRKFDRVLGLLLTGSDYRFWPRGATRRRGVVA